MKIRLILHDIRSVYNVGAIFRTADGAGVERIYLTGITPTPYDRFGRVRTDMEKTALGATQTVPWEYQEDVSACIAALRTASWQVIAIEQHPDAYPYTAIPAHDHIVLVYGSETEGLPDAVLSQVSSIAEIPMYGAKESLNVSVAAGISLYYLRTGSKLN